MSDFVLSPTYPHFRYMFHGGTNFGYWNGENRPCGGSREGQGAEISGWTDEGV